MLRRSLPLLLALACTGDEPTDPTDTDQSVLLVGSGADPRPQLQIMATDRWKRKTNTRDASNAAFFYQDSVDETVPLRECLSANFAVSVGNMNRRMILRRFCTQDGCAEGLKFYLLLIINRFN